MTWRLSWVSWARQITHGRNFSKGHFRTGLTHRGWRGISTKVTLRWVLLSTSSFQPIYLPKLLLNCHAPSWIFQKYLGLTKEAFNKEPQWKQLNIRKEKGLFWTLSPDGSSNDHFKINHTKGSHLRKWSSQWSWWLIVTNPSDTQTSSSCPKW